MPRFLAEGEPPLPVLPCPDPLEDADVVAGADPPPPLALELDPGPLEEGSWPQAVNSALMNTKVARRLHEDCSCMTGRSPEKTRGAQVFPTAAWTRLSGRRGTADPSMRRRHRGGGSASPIAHDPAPAW